ncbi:MAG: hypothetical protein KDI71_21345, partial [Xanthomonadales bacterium]|nr:hypothetical protein [Xanthomonadales bacterium]
MSDWVVQVVFSTPVPGPFDYLGGDLRPAVGARVLVDFGHRETVGFVVGSGPRDSACDRELKPLRAVLDEQPWFDDELWRSLSFVARYYHRGRGEVLSMALPAALRRVRLPTARAALGWRKADGVDGGAKTDLQQLLLSRLGNNWQPQELLLDEMPT